MSVSSPPWLRRIAENRLLDVGIVGLALVAILRLAVVLPSRATDWDFARFYLSSCAAREGPNPYTTPLSAAGLDDPSVDSTVVIRATNPPALVWLVAPLTLSPVRWAFALWTVLQAVGLGVILWLTRDLLGGRVSARGWRFVIGGTLISAPLYDHFCFGQVQLLLAAMVLGAYRCQRRGKDLSACLLVTAAGMLKLFPLVLLPWMIWRGVGGWRVKFLRTVVVLAAGGLILALTGWGFWCDYWRTGLPAVSGLAKGWACNYTVPSLVMNVGSLLAHDVSARWIWVVAVAIGWLVVAAGYAICGLNRTDREAQFCLMVVTMVAGGMVAWGHYLVFLIFPIVVMAARLSARFTMARWVGFGGVLLTLNCLGLAEQPWARCSPVVLYVANFLPLAGILGLGAMFVSELRRYS